MKTSFRNDYGRFAHPRILEAIAKYGEELNDPYGLDVHSQKAADYMKETFGAKGASVHFFAGGTVTNMTLLSYALRPYEAVVCCASGHINVHETGAIEGSGHKVVTVPAHNGKLTVEGLESAVAYHTDEHMVLPRAVYVSNATETGTIYKKEELLALRECCKKHGLCLYLDGARLGTALTSERNDIKPEELGSFCDAFYVGGGKNGLGIGEALVLVNPALQENFRYHIKNKGAMLAKGYLLGIEFEEGFRDGLYFELGKKANESAKKLYDILIAFDYRPLPVETNQVFAAFPKGIAEELVERFGCEIWERQEASTTLRFVTSYATKEEDLRALHDFFLQA